MTHTVAQYEADGEVAKVYSWRGPALGESAVPCGATVLTTVSIAAREQHARDAGADPSLDAARLRAPSALAPAASERMNSIDRNRVDRRGFVRTRSRAHSRTKDISLKNRNEVDARAPTLTFERVNVAEHELGNDIMLAPVAGMCVSHQGFAHR